MSGGSNRQGQNNRGEGEGPPAHIRSGNVRVSTSTATGSQGRTAPQEWGETGALPPNVRGPSGELLSAGRGRWRTLPSWLAGHPNRLGGVQGYSPRMATPADIRTQPRRVDRTIETEARPAVTATAQLLCPRSAGRGRGRTLPAWMDPILGTIPMLGGLQQHTATEAEPETGRFRQRGVSTSAFPAIVPLPVGGERQTTVPARIRARTRGSTLAVGGLQHQASSGAQQEGDQAPAADGRCLAVLGVAPGGLQQPSSRWSRTTSVTNVLPFPHTIGVRRNRTASGGRLSPRPTLRSRYRSPSPAAVGPAMIVPRPVGRGRQTTTPA